MQKQPPEMSVKKLLLKCSNIHRKTPVLESLFNLEYCKIFYSTYFEGISEKWDPKVEPWEGPKGRTLSWDSGVGPQGGS